MLADAPLLVFDSGIGGLSVADAISRVLPTAPMVYAADSAGFPYGIKSEQEIASRVPALLGRLVERYHPRLVVIACNTASTIALAHVRAALDVPVVGTVPAIKSAASISKTRTIGVLGTEATVRQPYVDQLSAQFAGDCVIIRQGSAALVELAEAKLRGGTIALAAVGAAIAPMFEAVGGADIDTVVLACTHFPLLLDELAEVVPRPVTFADGNEGIARRVQDLTQAQSWPAVRRLGISVMSRLDGHALSLAPALARRGFLTPVAL